MSLELDQANFRRLIWLQFVVLGLTLPITGFEVASDRWLAFDAAFNALSIQHLGQAANPSDELLALGAVAVVAYIVGLAGMLRYKSWSRLLFLASIALLSGGWLLVPVSYASPGVDLLEGVGATLDGAILILAYGRGLGQEWFAKT